MKGLVFTEFMEMVESTWSLDMVDRIIADSKVASGGAYTSVGTYPHDEMVALVVALSEQTNLPVAALVQTFGRYLFARFAQLYPRFFEGITDCFQFLGGIENVIHAEVRKLYPDAELPTFEVKSAADQMILTYYSEHSFADLAQGLLEGSVAHFGGGITLQRVAAPENTSAQARFILTRQV